MRHIGMFTPPSPGHMNPMSCLGRELLRRGHRVTYFQLRDVEQDVLRNGLEYVPIVEKDFPKGTLATIYAELGECQGGAALKYVVAWFSREASAGGFFCFARIFVPADSKWWAALFTASKSSL